MRRASGQFSDNGKENSGMNEVQKAVEEITYFGETLPKEAFRIIAENKEEAVPYLREAVDYAISKGKSLDENYQRHFYALYLLGELRDKESFPKIMELVSLGDNTVDYLIGDCITEDLREILYNTYNGDMELLKKSVQDRNIEEFVRSAMLDVMGQLYLDGNLAESAWKDFLKQCIYNGGEYNYFYDSVGRMICLCHFMDMLPEIRYMFDKDLLDEMAMGKYDSYIDEMFTYRENEKRFCETPFYAAEALKHWTMFTESEKSGKNTSAEKDFEKMMLRLEREMNKPVSKTKIGRNDVCPCGSGKKYKHCCLNKPKDVIDMIESLEERNKWLKNYPYTGPERVDGRIYLEDYFDKTSIEADKILYLALMNRPGLVWKRNMEEEEKRTKEYLYLAFQKCRARMKEEGILSFNEYDEKYSIHYLCKEWMGELCRLLQESDDIERYEEVRKFISAK